MLRQEAQKVAKEKSHKNTYTYSRNIERMC